LNFELRARSKIGPPHAFFTYVISPMQCSLVGFNLTVHWYKEKKSGNKRETHGKEREVLLPSFHISRVQQAHL